jgi:hypothetical protein
MGRFPLRGEEQPPIAGVGRHTPGLCPKREGGSRFGGASIIYLDQAFADGVFHQL